MLQEYIANSKWPSTITVRCITSTACSSAGDALREIDSMGVIRSDPFILISGDVISNMNLKNAIAFHKERRKMDPNAIITVSLKTVQRKGAGARALIGISPMHLINCFDIVRIDDLVVGIDRNTSQLLLFDDSFKRDSVKIPLEIMKEHSGIIFRTDLLDCHVDICSPELMIQFSDNFDYHDMRKDFIRGEVQNFELGSHIYSYIIKVCVVKHCFWELTMCCVE